MRRPRPQARRRAKVPQVEAAPPASATSVSPGEEAIERIVARARREGDGCRFGVFGESGTGKSYAMRRMVAELLAGDVADLALVHDIKGLEPNYDGDERRAVAELAARPVTGRVVVFRGDMRAGVECPAQEVAELAWTLARRDVRVLLVADELSYCTSPTGSEWRAPAWKDALDKGRQLRVSVGFTSQTPRRAPPEALDQVEALVLFRLSARARNYVRDVLELEDAVVAAVDELPDRRFVVVQKGRPWDGARYQFGRAPAPKRATLEALDPYQLAERLRRR